jgi:hypothetical protein
MVAEAVVRDDSVASPEEDRVLNAPVDAEVAPMGVPLIAPPVIFTLLMAKWSVRLATIADAPPPLE